MGATISTITISPETYDRLIQQRTNFERDVLKKYLQAKTLALHLENFLDEFEGAWDNDEQCASPEIAQEYIDAAKYMADNFGRINNRIRAIEEWLNNYLPY